MSPLAWDNVPKPWTLDSEPRESELWLNLLLAVWSQASGLRHLGLLLSSIKNALFEPLDQAMPEAILPSAF